MKPEIMKTRIRIRGDVDAGTARGLRVTADRVDVPAEGRPLREEGQDEERDDEQERERHARGPCCRSRPSPNAIAGTATSLRDEQERVADRDPVPAACERAAQRRRRRRGR